MSSATSNYRGRFAPSPTGPLHLGSLIAALASYLDARHRDGIWLLRMEDLDPPREEPGAADSILRSLEQHGLHWDETLLWQSKRREAYEHALQALHEQGQLFRCDCTRASIGPDGSCAGNCRDRQTVITTNYALRVQVESNAEIAFCDQLQGEQQDRLGQSLPDFVVRRKDGLFAYQLAVTVDDGTQGITHIVRGSDLLSSTARQIWLQQQLLLPTPSYCHLPVITTAAGQKFSKQNHAPPLDNSQAPSNLRLALSFLGQPEVPAEISDVQQLLAHAADQWNLSSVSAVPEIPAARLGLSL